MTKIASPISSKSFIVVFVAFKLFVYGKEMWRQLADGFASIIGRIAVRNSDDLFFVFATVIHADNADGMSRLRDSGSDALRLPKQVSLRMRAKSNIDMMS